MEYVMQAPFEDWVDWTETVRSVMSEIAELQKKVTAYQLRLKQSAKQEKRLREANTRLQKSVSEISTDKELSLDIERTKGGRQLTLRGSMALAIRRNFGNVACADVGSMLLEDITRWTVSRAETRAGSSLVASARLFFHGLYDEIVKPKRFSLVIHSFRQDATNSGILKCSKLAALLLQTAYLSVNDGDDGDGLSKEILREWRFDEIFESIIRVADVLPVIDGTSEGGVAADTRQLDNYPGPDPVLRTLRHHDIDTCVTWFVATTDAGSNEVGARRIIHAELLGNPQVYYFDTTCLEHSQHLVSLTALKCADRLLKGVRSWKYYASLATCATVCRDLCKKIFERWSEEHGAQSAKKHVRTLFPKACSGRWTGCDKPEQRFLQCGQSKLSPILSDVIMSKNSKTDSSSRKEKDHVDELAIEQQQEYSAKMGRWRRQAKQCLEDPVWWRCVEAMHLCRQPLSHVSNFLHQLQDTDKDMSHIAQLVLGKAANIRAEFDSLHQSDWLATLSRDLEADDAQFIRNFAMLDVIDRVTYESSVFLVLFTPFYR
ncbi:unnamed protein product [Symbiodinium sp. CCMP2592]|nr:unnamed protein product [Symbiodinium sp. CCMP2592]